LNVWYVLFQMAIILLIIDAALIRSINELEVENGLFKNVW
jgi:hypothetical protein